MKAKKIVDSFIFDKTEEPAIAYVIIKRAKECALVSVEWMIAAHHVYTQFNDVPLETAKYMIKHLEEIKEEIDKL